MVFYINFYLANETRSNQKACITWAGQPTSFLVSVTQDTQLKHTWLEHKTPNTNVKVKFWVSKDKWYKFHLHYIFFLKRLVSAFIFRYFSCQFLNIFLYFTKIYYFDIVKRISLWQCQAHHYYTDHHSFVSKCRGKILSLFQWLSFCKPLWTKLLK